MKTYYRYIRHLDVNDSGDYRNFSTLNQAVKDACEQIKQTSDDVSEFMIMKIRRPESYREAFEEIGFVPRLDDEICSELDDEWDNIEEEELLQIVRKKFNASGSPYGIPCEGEYDSKQWCWIDYDKLDEAIDRIRKERAEKANER